MEWTDESIARLRTLWQEGLSTAEIGRRMGITKNAVVGKAHRLDLAARPSPIRKAEPQSATTQPKRPAADKPRPATAEPIAPVLRHPVDQGADAAPPFSDIAIQEPPTAPALETAEPESVAVDPVPVERVSEAPVRTPEPVPSGQVAATALPDNVLLLRPDMSNPALPDVAPPTIAPMRSVGTQTEPQREPRRRGLTCCWPLGEPGTKGFHFCGGDPTPGKPYCAEHAALAYVKLRDRRDSVVA